MATFRTKTIEIFHTLSPLLKNVAEFLLHHPVKFAQESAAKISQEIGVSETTVIRFCTSIGYSGFSELQREVRESLYYSPLHQVEINEQKDTSPLQPFIDRELSNLKSTLEKIDSSNFFQSIDKLLCADRILISGSYNSYSMAHWLWYNLGQFLDRVYLFHPGTDNILYHLNQLSKNSVLFNCSFHRYALDTIWLSEEAKKKGVYTISVTDSPIAPIIKHSNLYFLVESYSEETFETSPSAAYGILHALVTGVTNCIREEEGRSRKDEYEYRLKKFFI